MLFASVQKVSFSLWFYKWVSGEVSVDIHISVLFFYTLADADLQQDLTDGTEVRQPTVYFKVTKILPKSHGHRATFLADVRHTTLFQVQPLAVYVSGNPCVILV